MALTQEQSDQIEAEVKSLASKVYSMGMHTGSYKILANVYRMCVLNKTTDDIKAYCEKALGDKVNDITIKTKRNNVES